MRVKYKLLILISIIIVASNVIVYFFSNNIMQEKIEDSLDLKLVSDLRLSLELLDNRIPGVWTTKDSELYKGDIALYRNYDLVDEISKLTNSNISIFSDDIRISTSIESPSDRDNRYIDKLADDIIKKKVLLSGETYIASETIENISSYALYHPIKNDFGRIIGMLSISVPNSSYLFLADEFRARMLLINLVVTTVCILLIYVLMGRSLKPIVSIRHEIAKFNAVDAGMDSDLLKKDELSMLEEEVKNFTSYFYEKLALITSIANGESMEPLELKSSGDRIDKSINAILFTLRDFKKEIDGLRHATKEGKLKLRADYDKFNGFWKELILGVDEISDTYYKAIQVTSAYVDDIGKGNIPEKIHDDYHGDFNEIKENLNNCIDAMNLLLSDAEYLIENADRGRFNARANSNNHSGDYKELISGINRVVDNVSKPTKEISRVLDDFSNGDYSSKFKGNYRGDYEDIKNSLNSTSSKISSYILDISRSLDKIGDGDFRDYIDDEFLGDFNAIKNAINKIVNVFNGVLLNINVLSGEISSHVHNLLDSSEIISTGSSDQSNAIQILTNSIEHFVFDSKSASDKSTRAGELARKLMEEVVEGSKDIDELLSFMKEIELSAEDISEVVRVIDQIALQTNLLALSAAVEASNAGIYGEKFNLIAKQVSELALRSAKASHETTILIEKSINKAKTALHKADKAANELDHMIDDIKGLVDAVSTVSSDMDKQLRAFREINHELHHVSSLTEVNNTLVSESAEETKELSEKTSRLKEEISNFKLKNEKKLYVLEKNKQINKK